VQGGGAEKGGSELGGSGAEMTCTCSWFFRARRTGTSPPSTRSSCPPQATEPPPPPSSSFPSAPLLSPPPAVVGAKGEKKSVVSRGHTRKKGSEAHAKARKERPPISPMFYTLSAKSNAAFRALPLIATDTNAKSAGAPFRRSFAGSVRSVLTSLPPPPPSRSVLGCARVCVWEGEGARKGVWGQGHRSEGAGCERMRGRARPEAGGGSPWVPKGARNRPSRRGAAITSNNTVGCRTNDKEEGGGRVRVRKLCAFTPLDKGGSLLPRTLTHALLPRTLTLASIRASL